MLDTFQFDEDFETRLLAFSVRDIKFYLRNVFVMRMDYFENELRRDIYQKSSQYVDKYSKPISVDILKNEIHQMYLTKKKKDVNIDDYFDLINKIFSMDLSGEEYTEDVLLAFARRQEMKSVLSDGIKRINNKQDLRPILTGVTKALTIGSKLELGYDYFSETVERSSRGYEPPEHVVGTGFKKLDRYLGGGLAGGEIGLLVGPSSRGKTAGLVNLAVGALMKRKNVFYIGFEGKMEDVAVRLDMRISRINRDDMVKESSKVRDSVTYFSHLFKKSLILKVFPTESVTVNDIDQYITHEEIIKEIKPDLIIIDYLNLCKRSNTKEDTWLGTNYREGKALAVRRNVPLWSAAQAKDGALKEHIVLPKHISEATIRIWSDSDVIIGLCQSDEEEAKLPAILRWYLGKNRNREAKKEIKMMFDKYKMLMEEIVS